MDRNEVLKGQELLARKLWPAISNKTNIVLLEGKHKSIIFPVMRGGFKRVLFEDVGAYQYRPVFDQIRIDIDAHTGGFMGYNAEIDTLVIRPLVTI